MKAYRVLILLFYIFSAPAVAMDLSAAFEKESKWTAENITYGLALVGLVADWRTTRDMGRYYNTPNPETGLTYYETGMYGIYGKYPTPREVNSYFLGLACVLTFLNTYEPNKKYRIYQNAFIAYVHIRAAKHNIDLGLNLKF